MASIVLRVVPARPRRRLTCSPTVLVDTVAAAGDVPGLVAGRAIRIQFLARPPSAAQTPGQSGVRANASLAAFGTGPSRRSRVISVRGGGADAAAGLRDPSRFVTYLTAVFHGMYPPEKVGPRTTREMRTLAEALDALGAGDLPRTADLLV